MSLKIEKKNDKKIMKKSRKIPPPKTQKIDPKLWECGKWLEIFLNENLRHEHFKNLAEKALEILEVKFDLTEKEPTLKYIEKMESLADPDTPLFDQWADVEIKIPNFYYFKDGYSKVLFKKGGEEIKETGDFSTSAILHVISPIPLTKRAIIGVFKKLPEIKKPWDVALAELVANESDVITKSCIELNLIGGSGGITNEYILENGKLRLVKSFEQGEGDPREIFNWNTAISQIFFKFLELGGKDYFIFCDRCGKFVAVQRKGRKRYCSEKCRVYSYFYR